MFLALDNKSSDSLTNLGIFNILLLPENEAYVWLFSHIHISVTRLVEFSQLPHIWKVYLASFPVVLITNALIVALSLIWRLENGVFWEVGTDD